VQLRVKTNGDVTEIQLTGHLDEDVGEVLEQIDRSIKTAQVVFDLGGVRKINSIGVRAWMGAFDRFDRRFASSYQRCPMAFVDMAMIVPSFVRHRHIDSFYSCLTCNQCKIEREVLIQLGADGTGARPEQPPCTRCGSKMDLDEDIDEVLEFFRELGAQRAANAAKAG
jgi:hypothetical protein